MKVVVDVFTFWFLMMMIERFGSTITSRDPGKQLGQRPITDHVSGSSGLLVDHKPSDYRNIVD